MLANDAVHPEPNQRYFSPIDDDATGRYRWLRQIAGRATASGASARRKELFSLQIPELNILGP